MQPIFVGDVQGCADELAELLDRAEGQFGDEFELWSVGDLINRGPDNRSALGRVRDLEALGRARYVLGNHEVTLLRCWLGLRSVSPYDTFRDILDAPDADDWMEWLRRRPLAETGRLGGQDFAMVHASVHPDWSLADVESAARTVEAHLRGPLDEVRSFLGGPFAPRDDLLGRLTRCRSVDADGGWSPELPEIAGVRAWHAVWSEAGHSYGVVYGHWALQGLHVAPGLRGLDTGCVHHGRGRDGMLTGWLPDPSAARPFDVPDEHFWQVPARRAYYAHRDARA